MTIWLDISRSPDYNPRVIDKKLFERGLDLFDIGKTLGDMAFEDAVELAKLGSTIIEGGYLRTGLVHAGRIDTGVLNAEHVQVGAATTFEEGFDPSTKETPEGSQAKVDAHNAQESPHNLPSYTKMQSDGIKVYDTGSNLRCHLGQYAAGKYGLKVINGEIYSTLFSTRIPGETKAYAEITTDGDITIYDTAARKGMALGGRSGQGTINWYLAGTEYAKAAVDAGTNKDLWIRSVQSASGIRLETVVGPEVEIAKGGASSIILTTPSAIIEVTLPMSLKADFIYLEPKNASDADVTVSGDLYVTGGLNVSGSPKNAIEETSYGKVALAARESPDVRYIDEGKAQLVNGECKIEVDPMLLECIVPNSDGTPWLVHLTPTTAEMLYVADIGTSYFVVKSSDATSNSTFYWYLSAIRKSFASARFQKDRFMAEEDVLTSNWEDELGVTITDGTENNVG